MVYIRTSAFRGSLSDYQWGKGTTNMPGQRSVWKNKPSVLICSAIDPGHNCGPLGVDIGLSNQVFTAAVCWWMQCVSKGHRQLNHHQHFPVVHMGPWAYACRWRLACVRDQLNQLPNQLSNYNILIGLWYIYARKVPLLSKYVLLRKKLSLSCA